MKSSRTDALQRPRRGVRIKGSITEGTTWSMLKLTRKRLQSTTSLKGVGREPTCPGSRACLLVLIAVKAIL